MAMSFACPSCKKVLKSNVALPVGKSVNCPACQTPLCHSLRRCCRSRGPHFPFLNRQRPRQSSMFDMVRPAGRGKSTRLPRSSRPSDHARRRVLA